MRVVRKGTVSAFVVAVVATLAVVENGEAQAPPTRVQSQRVELSVEQLLTDLREPVAMDFLPDGKALLAERAAARLRVYDPATGQSTHITSLPQIDTLGDGGLLDVVRDPAFADNRWIYLAYSEARPGGTATVLDRAVLDDGGLSSVERLFTATAAADAAHYGGRIAIDGEYVFLTIGDRQPRALPGRLEAQSLETHHGSIVRLHHDGSVPEDNPFVDQPGALPEIWSYGHRNAQGLAFHPESQALWLNEHGPQGGDEINIVREGGNYGWPVVTYGEEYGGGPVGDGLTRGRDMLQPAFFYRPSIGPSDMTFVSGRAIIEWTGSLLIGGMAIPHLGRLTLDGERVLHEERLFASEGWRVRMVEEGPDGMIYLGTDSGLLLRIGPA